MSASATEPIAAGPRRLESGFFEQLFEGAGLAVFACDTTGRIEAVNSLGAELLGDRAAASGALNLRDLLPPSDHKTFDDHLHRLVESRESLEFRTRITDATGVTEYALWLAPLFSADGHLRGMSAWFHDITARLQLRRSVRKNERLSTLGAMSGSVAHHYSNLLCSIATSLEYAVNMNTMTAMKRALHRTQEGVAKATELTRQLLAFAQADYRQSDMSDFLESVLHYADENEERLARRGIRLEVHWPELPPHLAVPRERMRVILGNIVENAVEAMPQGGTLTFAISHDDAHVRLAISDSGSGIRPDHLEHLFEPFFTTKGELSQGTRQALGMGLAVAHGLVRELHGTISASNIPDGGARFEITLPTSQRR
ncbi:MAG: PAS domain-containing protein [Phycisphaerales bacterium]|nr:PAS domain-containing protein [Phycisphaerales bacterium]